MNGLNRILVATEGSKFSDYAFSHAFGWAMKFKAQLEALYVREPWPLETMTRVPPRVMEEIQEEVEKNIRIKVGGIAPLKIAEGEPGAAINGWIEEHRPDLVVMGTHGRRGLKRALLGSVTEEVIRHSSVPVLAVKSDFKRIKSIVVAVKLNSADDATLKYAFNLSAAWKVPLTVLYVSAYLSQIARDHRVLSEMAEKALQENLRNKISPKILVLAGDATEQIAAEAKSHSLLILTARRKEILKDLVLGTTAERVLRYSTVPVLTVPGPVFIRRKGDDAENAQKTVAERIH